MQIVVGIITIIIVTFIKRYGQNTQFRIKWKQRPFVCLKQVGMNSQFHTLVVYSWHFLGRNSLAAYLAVKNQSH